MKDKIAIGDLIRIKSNLSWDPHSLSLDRHVIMRSKEIDPAGLFDITIFCVGDLKLILDVQSDMRGSEIYRKYIVMQDGHLWMIDEQYVELYAKGGINGEEGSD